MPKQICVVFIVCRGWNGFISDKERRRQWQLVQAAASCCESAAPWRKRPRPVASLVAGTDQLSIHQSNPWYSTVALPPPFFGSRTLLIQSQQDVCSFCCLIWLGCRSSSLADQPHPHQTCQERSNWRATLKGKYLDNYKKVDNIRCISWRWISWFCQSWHKQVWDNNWDRTAKGAGQRKWHRVQQDHRRQHDK